MDIYFQTVALLLLFAGLGCYGAVRNSPQAHFVALWLLRYIMLLAAVLAVCGVAT